MYNKQMVYVPDATNKKFPKKAFAAKSVVLNDTLFQSFGLKAYTYDEQALVNAFVFKILSNPNGDDSLMSMNRQTPSSTKALMWRPLDG